MKNFPAAAAAGELAETFRAGESQIGLGRDKMRDWKNENGKKKFGFHQIMDGIRTAAVTNKDLNLEV